MIKTKTIQQRQPEALGPDFDTLRQKGIRMLQELSSELWTDYNEHDPGVTILEALCYALTELTYKANMPMEDILASGRPDETRLEGALFPAPTILPTRPVTPNDFRKLLIDSISRAQNAWVIPRPRPGFRTKKYSFGGIYDVYLRMMHYPASTHEMDRAAAEAREVMMSHRNLGESLGKVVVQMPVDICIEAEISVSSDADVEDVLAQVLYDVQEFVTPIVPFESLRQIMEGDKSLDEVFNGPLLEHGFLRDELLKPPLRKLRFSEVLKVISSVPEVTGVISFTLIVDGQRLDASQAAHSFELNETPVLNITPSGLAGFRFERGQSVILPGIQEAINKLEALLASRQRMYRVDQSMEEFIDKPAGTKRDVRTYSSIQHEFPSNYGLGADKSMETQGKERRAQVRQLKGYLMLFEQVMADFLAQLYDVSSLYSTDPRNIQSYYHQLLTDVPSFWEMVRSKARDIAGKDNAVEEVYERDLHRLNLSHDQAMERRNRFLDNLLARFNERFDDYMLGKFDLYYGAQAMPAKVLEWKRHFLELVPVLSRDRGAGFNFTKPSWGIDPDASHPDHEAEALTIDVHGHVHDDGLNQCGLVRYISHRLGIFKDESRSLSKVMVEAGIQSRPRKPQFIETFTQSVFSLIDDVEYNLEVTREAAVEDAWSRDSSKFAFMIPSHMPTNVLMRYGIMSDSYFYSTRTEDGFCTVYFRPGEGANASPIYRAKNIESARGAVHRLMRQLRKLNIESEGMHLIEHILLLPPIDQPRFRFELVDPSTSAVRLVISKSATFEDRQQRFNDLLRLFRQEKLWIIEPKGDQFRLGLKEEDADEIAYSPTLAESEEACQKQKDQIIQLLEDYVTDKVSQEAVRMSCQYCWADGESGFIDERFFHCQASLMLPSWPARFQNEDFQQRLRELAIRNSPTHITTWFSWWGVADMKTFEDLLEAWLEAILEAPEEAEDEASKLVSWIIEFTSLHSKYRILQ